MAIFIDTRCQLVLIEPNCENDSDLAAAIEIACPSGSHYPCWP